MAHPPVPDAASEKYPGPSQTELGSLADWVSSTEFLRLQAGSRPARAPPSLPAARPSHRRRPERYSGPTRQELGDLADWLDPPTSSPRTAPTSDSHPASSIRGIEAELWVSETGAGAGRSPAESAETRSEVIERYDSDSFLEQLDEIQVALRKRAFA